MPSSPTARLTLLLEGPPAHWLGLLVLATPWVRFELGPWTLYPGLLALTLLLAAVLLDDGGWGLALRPLWPLVALGLYMAAVAALRGEWITAASMALLTVGHFCWGAAALRLGLRERGGGALREALVALLAATVGVGLALWLLQAAWPQACRAINCHEQALWPYPFTGGWGSAAHYALVLLFLLPPFAGPLVSSMQSLQSVRAGARRWVLPALGAVAGGGLVAGAPWWALLLAAAGWGLLLRHGAPNRRDGRRLLLQGLAAGGLFAVVLVYGLEPGYLHRLWGGEGALPPVRVTLPGPAPRHLSSELVRPLTVQLRNTGWSTIGGHSARPLQLAVTYLVTPERGTTRAVAGPRVWVPGRVAPGALLLVTLPIRPPHWVRDGYLTWQLELADGRRVPLARGSLSGFRFSNAAYRRLDLDPENHLSALALRARAFHNEARPPPVGEPDANSAAMVLGDVLDTLFFSPLWGEPGARNPRVAFSQRPFLFSLLHQYGLIGLALALWAGLRVYHRAVVCGQGGDPAWQLLPLCVLLIGAAGLFTPALGSLHFHWAFFLLAGYLEGRYARKFPWPTLRLAPRAPWRLRLRLPWRPGAPYRSHAGRVRR